jgi:hypothetical protein
MEELQIEAPVYDKEKPSTFDETEGFFIVNYEIDYSISSEL